MLNKVVNFIKTMFIDNFRSKEVDYSTWIFSSSFNTKFNYNSKYLFEYVLKNEPDITPIYVINDDEFRKELSRKYGDKYFIETKSNKGIRQVLNSGVWVTSAGLPVYGLGLNSKRMIVNLWHGVPLKKIALMENNLNKFTKLYFKYVFSKNYTYILTTSKELTPIMMESFGVEEKKIKVWGQPRNDAIFTDINKGQVLTSIYGDLPRYKKIILYAPTYREDTKTIFFPFNDLNIEELKDFLVKHELIIFIRCHQSEAQNIKDNFGDRVRLMNSDRVEEIMDIINIFDLLITDYSSIYIDYLLTEKPMVFLPYDKEEYLEQRGLNFDYDSVTPGPKPSDFMTFQKEILKLLNDGNYYYSDRKDKKLYFNEIIEPCAPLICEHIKKEIV